MGAVRAAAVVRLLARVPQAGPPGRSGDRANRGRSRPVGAAPPGCRRTRHDAGRAGRGSTTGGSWTSVRRRTRQKSVTARPCRPSGDRALATLVRDDQGKPLWEDQENGIYPVPGFAVAVALHPTEFDLSATPGPQSNSISLKVDIWDARCSHPVTRFPAHPAGRLDAPARGHPIGHPAARRVAATSDASGGQGEPRGHAGLPSGLPATGRT